MSKKYILKIDEEQARMLCMACEFYARMTCGQWQELTSHTLDLNREDYCEARDQMEDLLLQARGFAFPDLSHSFGHSYGVGKFHHSDIAWELYEVVRHCLAWTIHPEGGDTVDFGTPISFSGHALPVCTVKGEPDGT